MTNLVVRSAADSTSMTESELYASHQKMYFIGMGAKVRAHYTGTSVLSECSFWLWVSFAPGAVPTSLRHMTENTEFYKVLSYALQDL